MTLKDREEKIFPIGSCEQCTGNPNFVWKEKWPEVIIYVYSWIVTSDWLVVDLEGKELED